MLYVSKLLSIEHRYRHKNKKPAPCSVRYLIEYLKDFFVTDSQGQWEVIPVDKLGVGGYVEDNQIKPALKSCVFIKNIIYLFQNRQSKMMKDVGIFLDF